MRGREALALSPAFRWGIDLQAAVVVSVLVREQPKTGGRPNLEQSDRTFDLTENSQQRSAAAGRRSERMPMQ
jgi:hypothetical protein